uniref:SEFIR domain-containing protein n=1 Tax=Gongylonema pulchrum TaxID=637853 RepID=A0A183EZ18_9BILA
LATSVAWLLVVWRRCRKTISLREISLSKRASVFLVYTDDCDAHAAAVATLAELLKNYANADVFLDQFELKSADTVPARWFIEKLGTAEHIVLIFSEGTSTILGGRTLIQRQPFPEFFPTAVNFLISVNRFFNFLVFIRPQRY